MICFLGVLVCKIKFECNGCAFRYLVDLVLDHLRACVQESHLTPAQRAHLETASTPATLQMQRMPLTW